MLEFRVLGPLEVLGDHGPVRLGGPRQRATLAILLLDANRVVPVERIADELYAGRPPVTAVTQVQRQISELRRALGEPDAVQTRAPGYVLSAQPDAIDLGRFERLTAEAEQACERADTSLAAALLREALELWRGPPLADLADEPFARAAAARLEELRLAALGDRVDADLLLGRHGALIGELEALAHAHPLHERFRAHLMLALYRAGRQADALAVYRQTREALAERLGLEPSTGLRTLERAILSQDPSLDLRPAPAERAPSLLAAASRDEQLTPLLELARPLARGDLILARLVAREGELVRASAALQPHRSQARTAAFVSEDPAGDLVRLASANDVDLILVDAPPALDGPHVPPSLAALLERAPAHVAVVSGSGLAGVGPVFVPFGGGDHDWAALELAAWLAVSTGSALRLVGTRADVRTGRRDASRLLADASLAVQQLVDVDASPVLAAPGELTEAVRDGRVVVVGISPRWRHEGIGETRRELVRGARAPVLLVHRGPRPGGLAPRESRTRFTWTIGA